MSVEHEVIQVELSKRMFMAEVPRRTMWMNYSKYFLKQFSTSSWFGRDTRVSRVYVKTHGSVVGRNWSVEAL